MLAKECDYGFRKYQPVFFITLLLILIFYRGAAGPQTSAASATVAYAGIGEVATVPGVAWHPVPTQPADAVFDGPTWVDAYVEERNGVFDVTLNPRTMREAEVSFAVNSLRLAEPYRVERVSPAATEDGLAAAQHIAAGFILTFLCLYLPFLSWTTEEGMLWELAGSPVRNGMILAAKGIVIGALILVAWVFFWFLFEPGFAQVGLYALLGMLIMQIGMTLGIWQRKVWAKAALYGLILVILFVPSAVANLGILPSTWVCLGLLILGVGACTGVAHLSLHRLIEEERVR